MPQPGGRVTRLAATVALVVLSVSGGLVAAQRPAFAAAPACPQTSIAEGNRVGAYHLIS